MSGHPQSGAPALYSALALRILLPFGIGYCISFLFRVVNAVIADAMSAELGLDANMLGLLTSIYFATIAVFQLPLGVLLDRFGPRRVESVLLLLAAAGALVFAMATSAGWLMIGRAMIGLGVSACLMAAFIAYRRWFDSSRLPLVNGLQMAFGGLGALAGTRPAAMVLEAAGWRTLFLGLAVLTVVIAVVIWVVVPRDEPVSGEDRRQGASSSGSFRQVFADRTFWRIAPLVTFSQSAFLSIQSLWIGTWLRDVAGLDVLSASNVMAATTVAMIFGFLLLGWLSSRLVRYGLAIQTSSVFFMCLFLVPQLGIIAGGFSMPMAFWIAFGFFGTAGIIGYSAISHHFPVHIAGRANTALNFVVFVVAFFEQWGLGIVINQFPAGNGYDEAGYRLAMGLALAAQVAALAWYLLWRPRRNG